MNTLETEMGLEEKIPFFMCIFLAQLSNGKKYLPIKNLIVLDQKLVANINEKRHILTRYY